MIPMMWISGHGLVLSVEMFVGISDWVPLVRWLQLNVLALLRSVEPVLEGDLESILGLLIKLVGICSHGDHAEFGGRNDECASDVLGAPLIFYAGICLLIWARVLMATSWVLPQMGFDECF